MSWHRAGSCVKLVVSLHTPNISHSPNTERGRGGGRHEGENSASAAMISFGISFHLLYAKAFNMPLLKC